ncbi:MAG: hypothetical protein Q9224_002741 [Gallowayella concinna]
MAELPESGPAYQEFLRWKSITGHSNKGCRGFGNTIGSHYIPYHALLEYCTAERIKMLLEELFDKPTDLPPDTDRVRTYYLRPFAILLSIGCGRMISRFVDHRGLQDTSLPFTSESDDFPKSPTRDLFADFHKQQWHFCALELEYKMSYELSNDYILPITSMEKIGDGGSAILYRITVDEAYNKLKPPDSSYMAIENKTTNTFALKTYRTSEAEKYFRNERNAFDRLRHNGRPPANIIEYYGSFVRDGTYNIILEYADKGTLDDYMENTPEPKSIGDITTLWERFLASMGGLVHIHGTKSTASDGPNVLLGWHHDIDPSNILVVSRSQDSPYDCDFKIADLGLAHFKRYISSSNRATDNERYGMNAYGIHVEIQNNSRRNDFITPCVIEGLVNRMVRGSPDDRHPAHFLVRTSTQILDDAKRKQSEAMAAPNLDHTRWDTTVDVRKPRIPPSLPPDRSANSWSQPVKTRHSHTTPEQAETLRNSQVLHAQLGSYVSQRNSAPEPNREGHRRQYPMAHKEPLSDDLEVQRDESRMLHTLDGVFPELAQSFKQSPQAPRSFHTESSFSPYQPRGNRAIPAEDRGPAKSEDVMVSGNPYGFSNNHLTAPSGAPIAQRTVSESAPTTIPKPTRRQHPRMSVTEGLRIKKGKEHKDAKYPGEDDFRRSDDILKKRDHVFLVDNSETMGPHRPKVEAVLELLSTLTQPYDPNGLDLYFTTESGKLRPKTPEKFLKYLRDHPAEGVPDFRQRFAKIIEEYQRKFGRKNTMSRLRHPTSTPSKGPRPLSLYVLTDGVWDSECNLITEVKNLVALLQKHELPNKYVGIQFIRFGNDPKAKERLRDVIDTTSADGNVWKMLLGAVNDWYDNDGDSDDDAKDAVDIQH